MEKIIITDIIQQYEQQVASAEKWIKAGVNAKENVDFLKEYTKNKQIAEWLKELREYKSLGLTAEEIKNIAHIAEN